MSKYIEKESEKELIIKTNTEIINNLKNAKNELMIDKSKYSILEYTKDYINNLFKTIETINNNWNNLLDIFITYQDEIDYKNEINYTGVNNSINYIKEPDIMKGKVNTTSDYLNVRNSPNGEIISSIAPGTEINILEEDKDGWTKVLIDDKEAYVCSRYITLDKPLEIIDTKIVEVDSLNIRNYPNGDIISNVPYNTEIQVLAKSHNEWTKIIYDGKIAYVTSRGLK